MRLNKKNKIMNLQQQEDCKLEVVLEVKLEVPTSLDNNFKSLIGYINWEFLAEELEGTGPQTGDYMNYLPWVIGLTASAVLIIFIIAKRRKEQEEETK